MRYLKLYENFKVNNIKPIDIINCIRNGGSILTSIVKECPNHNPKLPLYPMDISETGDITVEIDSKIYYVDIDDIDSIQDPKIVETKKFPMTDPKLREIVPQKLTIITSNGEFELELSDCWVQFPKICLTYWHSTPEKTGDVLSDGEPDYLGFDLNIVKNSKNFEINVENTYGDTMMFEYKIVPPNSIIIGHYNGYKSKFDPNYVFSYREDSIEELIKFFNSFTFGTSLTRDKFNFLDIKPDSYKSEGVSNNH